MRQMNVQIVDDDQDFAESMADLVKNKGHNVIIAGNGNEALEQSKKEKIDITFMDVKMPGMNGVETFKAMRDINPAPHVVMMTAYTIDALINEALETGALGIMHKPVDTEQIYQVLTNMSDNMFILVVDDDPDFAHSISDLLRRQGYTVGIYTSSKMAMDHICNNGVNVLVVDIRLSDLDGIELSEKLQSMGITLPTIFVTGFPEESKRLESLGLDSIAGVLTKPFKHDDLLNLLDEIKVRFTALQ